MRPDTLNSILCLVSPFLCSFLPRSSKETPPLPHKMNPQIVDSPPGSGRELLEKALQYSLSKGEIFRVDNASYPDLEHLVSIAQRQKLK